jgi:hypothetical protein
MQRSGNEASIHGGRGLAILEPSHARKAYVEITGSMLRGPSGTPSQEERKKVIADFFAQNLK